MPGLRTPALGTSGSGKVSSEILLFAEPGSRWLVAAATQDTDACPYTWSCSLRWKPTGGPDWTLTQDLHSLISRLLLIVLLLGVDRLLTVCTERNTAWSPRGSGHPLPLLSGGEASGCSHGGGVPASPCHWLSVTPQRLLPSLTRDKGHEKARGCHRSGRNRDKQHPCKGPGAHGLRIHSPRHALLTVTRCDLYVTREKSP